jgi:hypothetical protein
MLILWLKSKARAREKESKNENYFDMQLQTGHKVIPTIYIEGEGRALHTQMESDIHKLSLLLHLQCYQTVDAH